MDKSIMSLEEITSKVFEIRQRKHNEVDIPYHKEIDEYLQTHIKPKVPFFSFGKRRSKAKEEVKKYEEGLKSIQQKYQNHPLIKELEELQEQCPHNYDSWQEIDGPSEMRTCRVCYHKQHRWNFDNYGRSSWY